MNQTKKTITFVVCGLVLGVCAAGSHYMTRPKSIDRFERVGTEFFEAFRDPMLATSMEVSSIDPDTKQLKEFKVEFQDGVWRIPSHDNYPAEAADRLAQTAVSLIGLKRESLAARRANQFKLYGVIDPKSPDAKNPKETGKRITLKDGQGNTLADYIIGAPAGSATGPESGMAARELEKQDDYFYVRVPDENETYKAKIQLDLSTKFSDWIEPDLLKLESQDLRELKIDNYELRDNLVTTPQGLVLRKEKAQGDINLLTRDTGFGSWNLDGMNTEIEELESSKISDIVNFLDDLEITDVRPKPTYNGQLLITPDCNLNQIPELMQNRPLLQQKLQELELDLNETGFEIVAVDQSQQNFGLVGTNGELSAVTDDGVVYSLYFGKLFYGDDNTIEIGQGNSGDEESDQAGEKDGEDEETTTQDGDQNKTDTLENGQGDSQNKSQYVAIRVQFDQSRLGEKPVEPSAPNEPEKPEGYDQWKKQQDEKGKAVEETGGAVEKPNGQDSDGQSDNADDQPQDPQSDATKKSEGETQDKQDDAPKPPADVLSEADKKFQEYEQKLEEYNTAKQQHDTDMSIYEGELATYTDREKAGQEKAKELNERFAQWFYVVSAANLAKLKLPRAELVKAKESTEVPPLQPDLPGASLPIRPDITLPQDSGDEKSGDEKSGDDKSADDKSGDDKSGDDKSGDDKSGAA